MKLKFLVIRWFWAVTDFITRPGKDVFYTVKFFILSKPYYLFVVVLTAYRAAASTSGYPLTAIHIMSVLVLKMGDISPFL